MSSSLVKNLSSLGIEDNLVQTVDNTVDETMGIILNDKIPYSSSSQKLVRSLYTSPEILAQLKPIAQAHFDGKEDASLAFISLFSFGLHNGRYFGTYFYFPEFVQRPVYPYSPDKLASIKIDRRGPNFFLDYEW